MKVISALLCTLIFVLIFNVGAFSDVPHYFSYQGRLADNHGNPLNDTVELDFRIYSDEAGTDMLWQETHSSVIIIDGLFNVFLGSVKALPDSIFDGSVLWLGIKVDGGDALQPPTPFLASPYSFRSIHADTADFAINAPGGVDGWSQSGNYVHLADIGDSVGIGALTPLDKLHVGGNLLLGAYGDIRFSADNTSIDCESNDLKIRAQSDIFLEPYDDLYIRSREGINFMRIEVDNKRVGIRTHNLTHPLTVNGSIGVQESGETKYHINYYQGGLNIAETGVQDRRIHISDGGNVGIGTSNPTEKFYVNGNAYVDGNAHIAGTLHADEFEEDAIDRHNIIDEVGIASAASVMWWIPITTSWQSYLSKQITIPTSGYIFTLATAEIDLDHGISGGTYANVAVSDSPTEPSHDFSRGPYLALNVPAGYYGSIVNCHKVFYKDSPGTYTFYLLANKGEDNEATLSDPQMDLIFIPTSLSGGGTKDENIAGDSPDKLSSHSEGRGLRREMEKIEKSRKHADDLLTNESNAALISKVEALTSEIEELKSRIETLESQ
ncbi:MAG: hypothetical protein GF310_11120 [candidate division Zixibacteria bacterium]|nr:hypothetical protein [candidate division Zixibacteria bacterium]